MLDAVTKRRIDTARDILVGKVPDPKSQVEQITIALIYKFMDDMDRESVQMGGKASFFTGDYKKFAWTKMFDPKLGGAETFDLYVDAISKMSKNSNIPKLFRDIFKNAYLPYKDPETLKLFLKTINEFTYDHSEKLGDAFEYLLSVLGSQGDAGQFRTPRHIIDFIVSIVDPKKDETVLDPACGTAGFLISAYKHILAANLKKSPGDKLNPSERKSLLTNFSGYDISPDMVRLSLVNLYLHGFVQPQIYEYDTLTSEERWKEYADVILANPPFMTPKGGIKPHKRFSVQSNRSEVLFVDYMAEHLNPNGRAGIIVPEGIIFQSQNAYTELRKMLVDNFLVAVVSLPAGVFNPYSLVKTSILILDKSIAKQSKSIAFFRVENDGFGLGSQRRANEGEELTQVKDELLEYLKVIRSNQSTANLQPAIGLIVAKKLIAANGDYNLSGERYRIIDTKSSKYPLVSLNEICEINPQTAIPLDLFPDSYFNYIDISCVENETGKLLGANKILSSEAPSRARRAVTEGDVLLSTVRPNLKAFALLNEVPNRAIASTGFAVLRAKADKLSPGYLISMLRHKKAVDQMLGMMDKGAYPSINQTDVASIKIPLPTLLIQKKIAKEIDGYQKVIDGARAVLVNYHPHIPIDPTWPMVELGAVLKLSSGRGLTQQDMKEGPYPVYGGNGKTGLHSKYFIDDPIIVIGRVGAYCGAIHLTEPKSWVTDNGLYVTEYKQKVNQNYLAQALSQLDLNKFAKVGGQPSISQTTVYEQYIPLPSLEIQHKIITEIKTEQALVSANRELIERFEKKIQLTIARVWGEDSSIKSEQKPNN